MSQADRTVNVRMADELVQQIDACYDSRGFGNRSEFIRSAVRDAIQAEDPFTDEARQEIEEARQLYDEESADDLDPVLEQLGLDPLPDVDEGAEEQEILTPELYEEGQDTWTDETNVTIVGLGGAGARIVTRLHSEELTAADTVVIDSDEDTLDETTANTRLHLELPPDRSHDSKAEQIEHILENSQEKLAEQIFASTDLVFIVSGIGGSSGTVMTPIVSRAARNAGAVVTTISTLPHTLEQERRQRARSDIQEFQASSDTFVLIDAARFASFTPELSPGEVFETINEYLEEALRQMVWHREYIGKIADEDEQTGLASFFRGGGYATLSTLSASEVGEFTEIQNQLFQRSLISQASDTTGSLLHLVRVNMNKITQEDTAALIQVLSGEPGELAPNNVNINIIQDNDMNAAVRLTSIMTDLEFSLDDIISESEETEAPEEEGGIIVKRDNTVKEVQQRNSMTQAQPTASPSTA